MDLEEKYPDDCFGHWIVMLSTMEAEISEDGIKKQIGHYKEYEGADGFDDLKAEVQQIKENGDVHAFMETVRDFEIDRIKEADLDLMVDIILKD